MTDDLSRIRADGLTVLIGRLAATLHAAGIPEATAVRLLAKASSAVLQVLTLELLLEPPRQAAAMPERIAEPQHHPVEPELRLAA